MNDVLIISLYGLMIGVVGTGLGGLVSIFINDNDRNSSFLLGLTGGFMLYIVTFQLLPESFTLGGLYVTIVGLIQGILLVIIVETYIGHKSINPNLKGSLVHGICIAAHNFPEGLALGSSFFTLSNLGPILSIAMLLHNIPEGLSMAMHLKIHKVDSSKIIFYTVLTGVPTGIGAFIGAYVGSISDIFISLSLSLAGGAMLYIITDEIIPNAKALSKGRASSIGVVIGFIIGMIL